VYLQTSEDAETGGEAGSRAAMRLPCLPSVFNRSVAPRAPHPQSGPWNFPLV